MASFRNDLQDPLAAFVGLVHFVQPSDWARANIVSIGSDGFRLISSSIAEGPRVKRYCVHPSIILLV